MGSRAEAVQRRFELPVLLAAVASVPVALLAGAPLDEPLATLCDVLNWAVWAVFLVEALAMLAVVDDRRAWLRRHPLEVVVIVLTVPLAAQALQAARVLRLAGLLRVVFTANRARAFFSLQGVGLVALVTSVVVVTGGVAFAAVERLSIGTGLYWAVTTVTTVGYGDVDPTTTDGRVIAVLVMVTGIGSTAVLTAALAQAAIRRTGGAGAERAEGAREELALLREEVAALRAHLEARDERHPGGG